MTEKVEVLSPSECLALLSQTTVGRIGASIGALPVILPVRFVLFGETVLFRTIPGTQLDAATIGAVIAFQADFYDPAGPTAWSVLLQGIASEVSGQATMAHSVPIAPWGDAGSPGRLVQIDTALVSGRRFRFS